MANKQFLGYGLILKWENKSTDARKDRWAGCNGKQRWTWTSNVMDWCDLSYTNCLEWQNIEKNGVPW